MDFTSVSTNDKEKAASIKTPIILFATKHDVLFPGEKMIKRATQIFLSLKESVLLHNSKHVQSTSDSRFIENLILET